MRPPVLQEDAAQRENAERERRQKLKQKARDKERTTKERAAAEREASEREARSRQEAEAKQQKKEAAAERWGCACWEDQKANAWCNALARQLVESSSEKRRQLPKGGAACHRALRAVMLHLFDALATLLPAGSKEAAMTHWHRLAAC